ncbi:MAG: acetylglutamate kinase [Actinomycetota bacterium]
MIEALAKAAVLTEALPYIRQWAGSKVVIKTGGEVIEDPELLDSLVTDVVLLRFVGINPILIHGGGPQISAEMQRRGIAPSFVDGRRITDAPTMQIVRSVLLEINKEIVAAMNRHGGQAVGISGEDGPLLVARSADGGRLGYVGEIERVEPSVLGLLMQGEFIPVVAPVASGPDGPRNVNADTAAAAVAGAVGARKIVFLTNVPGLYADLGDAGSLISQIKVAELERMLAGGELSDGMIPKIRAAVGAMRSGVPQAHLLDGRIGHALLLEIFTDQGVGTMVLP